MEKFPSSKRISFGLGTIDMEDSGEDVERVLHPIMDTVIPKSRKNRLFFISWLIIVYYVIV
ncbi:hypothetical protein GCM10023331_39060 [Algivirga pacifica]|uniref:Uncharacterized protein n=1 Tax=Algivirga pacifica TaxID=1162670 RepID=A0ABP9DRH2_9BACT